MVRRRACGRERFPPGGRSRSSAAGEPSATSSRRTLAIAATFATQENYDAFLAELEQNGVVPGTVVLDDKWQAAYGTNEPDKAKWPDLPGWIADRHARGQHVLLWWKAWDPEGIDPELCIRNPDGEPIAVDPSHPEARELLRVTYADALGRTASTPTGSRSTSPRGRRAGARWRGTARAGGSRCSTTCSPLVYDAAKEAKQDALVITHTPHPAFADVTDMIRLNDMIGGASAPRRAADAPPRAGRPRGRARSSSIDTDDWRIPSLAAGASTSR